MFYFNRFFALLVSYGLRTYSWRKYRVYVEVQAIQVSLLAGRIFFKGLRYHGENETILIHSGHITWRYWYRTVKEIDLARSSGPTGKESSKHNQRHGEKGGIESSGRSLPCRLLISAQGLEWYLYNRSAAYDALVSSILSQDGIRPGSENRFHGLERGAPSMETDAKSFSPPEGGKQNARSSISNLDKLSGQFRHRLSTLVNKNLEHNEEGQHSHVLADRSASSDFPLLKLLPVHIVCHKGAVVMGNERVRCILIVKFDKASGEIDATYCPPPDPFRQLVNFHFTHPVMQMKPNLAYNESPSGMAAQGKGSNINRPLTEALPGHPRQHQEKPRKHLSFWRKSVPSYRGRLNSKTQRESDNPFHTGLRTKRWVGLSRYLDAPAHEDHDPWRSIEYARCFTIVDSPGLSITYYWDVAGEVMHMNNSSGESKPKTAYINRGLPPEWGLDLTFEGGTINYGPWSDRHRLELQSIFFPRLFKEAAPATVLEIGKPRVSTAFKVFIELRDQMTLRIPTRESSKDAKWKMPAENFSTPQRPAEGNRKKGSNSNQKRGNRLSGEPIRPHGWLDIKISSDSTISYIMDMTASADGFHSTLDLDFHRTEISTSVNHGILWRCDAMKTICELPTPLKWNALHTWAFNIFSDSTEVFLLREHIMLFSDLITDWSSGPPPDYYTFVPFRYVITLKLRDFQLYLNVNDANIINSPCDLDDNTFTIIQAPSLESSIVVPLTKYRPDWNEIPFQVDTNHCQVNLHTPSWKTQSAFFGSGNIGTLKAVSLRGRYEYYTSVSPTLTDTLILDIRGLGPALDLFGFMVRYFIKIKDNYFGEDIHFKTLDEYQALSANREISIGEGGDAREPQTLKNGLDVIMNIEAVDVHINLPANLYTAKDGIQISVASLDVDLRFTNYYMDLAVRFSPLSASLTADNGASTDSRDAMSVPELFVDGLDIHGHRLFGLPPTEPTYMCNWDFQLGKVTGECNVEFLRKFVSGGRNFIFSFEDDENSLPPLRPDTIPDVTFLRVRTQSLQVWLHAGHGAFLLNASAMTLNLNDWATASLSKRVDLRLPDLKVDCIISNSGSYHKEVGSRPSHSDGHLETTLTLSIIEKKSASTEFFQRQQEHIELHDQWTSRSNFLLRSRKPNDFHAQGAEQGQRDPATMPLPSMSPPVTDAHNWLSERATRRQARMSLSSTNTSSRRSSFLLHSLPHKVSTSTANTSRSSSSNSGSVPMPTTSWIRTLGCQSLGPLNESVPRNDLAPKQKYSGPSLPDFAFSSSFLSPYFPLRFVQPSTEGVPHFPIQEDELGYEDTRLSRSMTTSKTADEECNHMAVIIRFGPGLVAFTTPQAVASSTELLRQLEATDPADMLDELQVDVISKVSEFAKTSRTTKTMLDLNLRLPYVHLRFIDRFLDTRSEPNRQTEAEYNMLLHNSSATLRFIRQGTITSVSKLTTLHAQLDSVGVSVGIPRVDAAIQGTVEHIMFQFCEDKVLSVALQFKGLELAAQSRQMEYITGLLERTSLYAQEVSRKSAPIAQEKSTRLKALVFFLITKGKNIPDPASLTRPSYVLRTAPDHLRLSDSWKIISRLRQIYQNLSANSRDELGTNISLIALSCPVDAGNRVVEVLDEWRSWELAHVKKSYVMQKLYGPRKVSTPATRSGFPFKISVNTRAIKFLVDPGPNQSEVGLDVLVVCIKNNLPEADTDKLLVSSPNVSRHATIIEVHSEKTMIRLNWDLCELAAQLLLMRRKDLAIQQPTTEHSRPQHTVKDTPYHIVYITNAATVTFDSTNIKYMAACNSLQASVLAHEDTVKRNHLVTVAVRTTAGTSEVLSHGRLLATSKVVQPNFYGSHEQRASDGKPVANMKLAGTCKELFCDIEGEFSGLMQTIDLIVGEEFARLHGLLGRLSTDAHYDQPRNFIDRGTSSNQFNVALSMDTYCLSVILIPSLSYVMSGRVARASITPRPKSVYVLHFDLKEQLHQMLVQKGANKDSLSALRVPSVNGRIVGRQSESGNHCQVLISVDAVKIEAAAISNFLVMLNRPELITFTKEVARDWKSIKAHIDKVLGSHTQDSSTLSVPVKSLTYDCRFAVSGIRVHATAPSLNVDSGTCEIELNLGRLHIRASSKAESQGAILNSPDIHFALPNISADLTSCQGLLRQPCGRIALGAHVEFSSVMDPVRGLVGSYHAKVNRLQIDLFPETASTAVHIVGHLQDIVKGLDFSREAHYLRKLRKPKPLPTGITPSDDVGSKQVETTLSTFSAVYSLEVLSIQIQWIARNSNLDSTSEKAQVLVLRSDRIDLITREGKTARLKIEVLQLQLIPVEQHEGGLSRHSALLPEVTFNVAYLSNSHTYKLAFQAAGQLLELRFTPQFIPLAANLQRSMDAACAKLEEALASWDRPSSGSGGEQKVTRPGKSLMSVLVDADFAGAVAYMQGTESLPSGSAAYQVSGNSKIPHRGRHEQPSHGDSSNITTLRAPGVALKMEYKGDSPTSPSLNGEIKINSSTNVLYPSFVSLVLELTSSIKDVISKSGEEQKPNRCRSRQQNNREEDSILQPEGMLRRCKLNVGLRICKQEFTLGCQPIAKVTASTSFEEVYITLNTMQSSDYDQVFTVSAVLSQIQAAVQHVYSRDPTGSLEVDSVSLSVMNSKNLSGTSGISAILRMGLTKSSINARQIQDFLLFRELWIPIDTHASTNSANITSAKEPQAYLVQRSHQVAAASAVPWNITVDITELKLQMELGQALGRSCLTICNFWTSSQKSSNWEQNLCLGFDKIAIHGSGRLSELVEIYTCKIRTSIQWPSREQALVERPLVQAAVSFNRLLVRVAFDHQLFLIARVNSFQFFMYNAREQALAKTDRLVATLDGDEVHISCTATSAAQGAALYQAILRLVQEKQAALEASLQDVQRYIRRRSNGGEGGPQQPSSVPVAKNNTWQRAPASLDTDVAVAIKVLSVGVFPSTLFDNQVFKVEVQNAQARFDVAMDQRRTHSRLDLTLGQLRIAVSIPRRMRIPTQTEEVDINEIVDRAAGSRDGTILKVPRVVATMQTWQDPETNHIDYIFRSSFEGKVDVGWNYSRIGFIRGLWSSHSRALAQRLGKPVSQSTVKITGGPRPELAAGAEADISGPEGKPVKITAVVNVPQSRYEYRALESPVIETPQLRDMGEATPPLEWIGFQRDKLPHLTHQIIIVALLKVTREVEDAYSRILGSS